MMDEESIRYQTVDSETIKSEVPDGVENSSLQTATVDGTQEDRLAEAAERSELDEEKNERYQTAVFTLATFAAVFVLYVYVVYSLSSPPTLFRC
ncbi:PREDICTED: uncharacterized protein LOC105451020 isoform X2 [Wasmannia auropunctata]|uniref:uncharacterized protein LOC105451020 isoform X2 n=1 Tax=Wasmannia auropunctata TaxID=64793 RepID=UPI0005EE26EA|nr:PREDICTED: uncharacterized protein LOC105451020 isoform X2 [Wasmannia auropunctata]